MVVASGAWGEKGSWGRDDDEVGGCHLSHLENGRQEEGVRKNGWPGSGCKWIFIRSRY